MTSLFVLLLILWNQNDLQVVISWTVIWYMHIKYVDYMYYFCNKIRSISYHNIRGIDAYIWIESFLILKKNHWNIFICVNYLCFQNSICELERTEDGLPKYAFKIPNLSFLVQRLMLVKPECLLWAGTMKPRYMFTLFNLDICVLWADDL